MTRQFPLLGLDLGRARCRSHAVRSRRQGFFFDLDVKFVLRDVDVDGFLHLGGTCSYARYNLIYRGILRHMAIFALHILFVTLLNNFILSYTIQNNLLTFVHLFI